MRNLVLLQEQRSRLDLNNEHKNDSGACLMDVCHTPALPIDSIHSNQPEEEEEEEDNVVLLFSAGLLIRCDKSGRVQWKSDLSAQLLQQDDENNNTQQQHQHWIRVTYLDELDRLVCLSQQGAILTVHPESGTMDDLVGTFENGIYAAEWSHDLQTLILFTKDSNRQCVLIAMNAAFDILSELLVESAVLSNEDDANNASVEISWQPDASSTFVLSTLDAADNTRRLRFYHTHPQLQNYAVGLAEDGSGRTIPGLTGVNTTIKPHRCSTSHTVAWGGGLASDLGASTVAAVQRSASGRSTRVLFFERNGFKHGKFQLRIASRSM